MSDIRKSIDSENLKKILSNVPNCREFYKELTGEKLSTKNADDSFAEVASKWDYDKSLPIIREMFTDTEKYRNGKLAEKSLDVLLGEWKAKYWGPVEWTITQAPNAFDQFVQGINKSKGTGGAAGRDAKDIEVMKAAAQYRRIKEINTVRNDFIETLIFEKHPNILPTLNHSRSIDFFIDGVPFDQKVSRSPTKEFKNKYGEKNWKKQAIKNPHEVAEFLYKYQGETRFGYEYRLLVVYLDEDIGAQRIKMAIENADLEQPVDLKFIYSGDGKEYTTKYFIILLHT